MNIGILGGTFDPIHMGHLVLAEEARIHLGLNEVLFVPAGQPRFKPPRDVTPALQRQEMVQRAIDGNPYFKICTLEVEHGGPSYTVDTLEALKEQLGEGTGLFFILGYDTLTTLALWKEPQRLMQLCRLVVAPRSGSEVDLGFLEMALPGVENYIVQIRMPLLEISSSNIRRRVARGASIRYLVPDAVAEYIAAQKLYLSREILNI